MKRQIKRLSPHQNGKVAGVLMAIVTLPFLSLMMIPMAMMPSMDHQGNPIGFGFPFGMMLLAPLFYLIATYLSVALGCWVYNICYKFLGGFELEFSEEE